MCDGLCGRVAFLAHCCTTTWTSLLNFSMLQFVLKSVGGALRQIGEMVEMQGALSERAGKILNLLMYSCDYVSLKEIAEKTSVSKRSIYYDICGINDWLDSNHLPSLKIVRGKGILISEDEKARIAEASGKHAATMEYVFLPSERVHIIVCCIVHSRTPVYVEQLMDACQVSRNTIFSDLQILAQQLREYHVKLTYAPKTGYQIAGEVVHVRALFFLFFDALRPLLAEDRLTFLDHEEISTYYQRLIDLKTELHVDYVDGILYSLAALLPIMCNSSDRLEFPGLKAEKIYSSREFRAVEKHFPELRKEEQVYLSLHLLGSRLSVSTDTIFEDKSDQSIYGIVKTLVTEFEKIACVYFESRDELERALFIHIRSSLYRFHYGIQLGNPMREDIVREYPNLFNITKTVSQYLERMIGLPVTDSEIAYLTLHFGAFLKIAERENPKLRILIVCVNGVSTGNMLRHEVEKLLPDAEIVGLVAAVDVAHSREMCDLIISTAPIRSMIPVIVVHPILTNDDRRYILNHRLVQHSWQGGLADILFEAISKYIDITHHNDVRKEIRRCLQGNHEAANYGKEEKPGILDLLTTNKIGISDETMNWMDAVYFAGESLIRAGSIVEKYLDSIISQTMYYGTYMFINDEIMLAHAKPQEGVNNLDLSMTIFRNPIAFSEKKFAKMIIVLCAEDNERHLRIMDELLKLAQSEEHISRITIAEHADEVLHILEDALKKND